MCAAVDVKLVDNDTVMHGNGDWELQTPPFLILASHFTPIPC